MGVNAHNVDGYIIWDHGDSSISLVSSEGWRISLKGCFTRQRMVVDGADNEVIELKGYTSWVIGYSVPTLVKGVA